MWGCMNKRFLNLFFLVILYGILINRSIAAELYDVSEKVIVSEKTEEIDATIRYETEEIQKLQNIYGISDEVLWLYNELGISLFFKGDYQVALNNFDYILKKKIHEKENLLIGAALWGKALCHACLDMTEEMLQDFQMLELYFKHLFQFDCPSKRHRRIFASSNSVPSFSNLISSTKIEFAYPNEKISVAECRDRVRGSAEKLRLFIGPLIRDTAKRILFIKFIDALEEEGVFCCRDGSIWTTCVSPILEKLQKWKIIGVPADPAWD